MTHISELLLPMFERLDRIESMIKQTDKSNLMTIKDIVNYARLSEPTIRRAIIKGGLKPLKEGGKKLFRRADVDRWLEG